jgi:hypothetical protein
VQGGIRNAEYKNYQQKGFQKLRARGSAPLQNRATITRFA